MAGLASLVRGFSWLMQLVLRGWTGPQAPLSAVCHAHHTKTSPLKGPQVSSGSFFRASGCHVGSS